MLKKLVLLLAVAAVITLVTPTNAMAYGAVHCGYTHVGPNGVYHTGTTAAYGPRGVATTGHTTAVGAGGGAYHTGYGAAAGYGGAYHYSTPYAGATGVGAVRYGYVR